MDLTVRLPPAPTQHEIRDPKTGKVAREWLAWFNLVKERSEAAAIEVGGNVIIPGTLTTGGDTGVNGDLDVTGTADIAGALEAASIATTGDATIEGDLEVGGRIDAGEGIRLENVSVDGARPNIAGSAYDAELGEVGNSSHLGPALKLGLLSEAKGWSIGPDMLGTSPALRFIPAIDSSTYRYAVQIVRTAAGVYRLMPHEALDLYLGADSSDGFASGNRIQGIKTVDCNATAGYVERGRTAKMGEWTAVAFNSGDFTADVGNWTVDSADQVAFSYMLVGKTMYVVFAITLTDVSSTPSVLRIAIPGGFTATLDTRFPIFIQDAGATQIVSMGRVLASGTQIVCYANPAASGNWTATSADNTSVYGAAFFEVN